MPYQLVSTASENQCSDCVSMKLEVKPIVSSKRARISSLIASWLSFFPHILGFRSVDSHTNSKFHVLLTIQFNEAWESLIAGKIRFGLKRGVLRFHLSDCSMPLESRESGTPLLKYLSVERVEGKGSENSYGLDTSVSADKLGLKSAASTKAISSLTNKYQLDVGQVSRIGGEENPGLLFEEKVADILKGHLQKEPLGILQLESLNSSCVATFKASLMEDLYVTGGKGLWSENLSKTRRAFLARIIAKHLLEKRFGDYLSKTELSVINVPQNHLIEKVSKQRISIG